MLFSKQKIKLSAKSMEDEIKALKDKKEYLQSQINKYDHLENFERGNLFCSKDLYGELYYKYLPLSYIETSFYTHAADLYPHVNCTFEGYSFQNNVDQIKKEPNQCITLSFAMLCLAVNQSEAGPILILNEPFKTLQTKPLKNASLNDAMNWVGRMVIADLVITPTALLDDEFEMKGIRILNLTKNGVIENGKERIFNWNDPVKQLMRGNKSRVIANDKIIFHTYKDSVGEKACMHAMKAIQEIINSKSLLFFREDKNTLWLRLDWEIIGLFFRNNRLEFIYKPENNIRESILSDGSTTTLYNMMNQILKTSTNSTLLTPKEQHEKDIIDLCVIKHYLYEGHLQYKRS